MATHAPEAYRGMNYDIAEAMAPTWERRRADIERAVAPARAWMVRELRPQPGDTVLELAAGTGDTGLEVLPLVGERGRLILSDFSPAMLDAARRRVAAVGADNVGLRLIDAERIELDDDAVDGVLCRFGYMLMADAAAALAETRRVLRPGGRVTLAVWAAPERNPFFAASAIPLIRRGHVPPPEPPPAPGIFSMANPGRTAALLRAAGFTAVRTEEVPVHFEIPGIDEYVSTVADTAGSIALALRSLDERERDAIKADAEAALERFRGDHGYVIPGVVLCAAAS